MRWNRWDEERDCTKWTAGGSHALWQAAGLKRGEPLTVLPCKVQQEAQTDDILPETVSLKCSWKPTEDDGSWFKCVFGSSSVSHSFILSDYWVTAGDKWKYTWTASYVPIVVKSYTLYRVYWVQILAFQFPPITTNYFILQLHIQEWPTFSLLFVQRSSACFSRTGFNAVNIL